MDKLDPLPAEVGGRLAEVRTKRGITRAALARACECDAKTVWRWERGRVLPGSRSLVRLADALAVSPHWLLTGAEAAA